MTIIELRDMLDKIIHDECGDNEIQVWDSDENEWSSITCITFGKTEPAQIYSD